jgi:hypothetical protein
MLPKPALAQDGFYGRRNQSYHRDRGWDNRYNGQWGSGFWGDRDRRERRAEERRQTEWRSHQRREHEWRERQRWNNKADYVTLPDFARLIAISLVRPDGVRTKNLTGTGVRTWRP